MMTTSKFSPLTKHGQPVKKKATPGFYPKTEPTEKRSSSSVGPQTTVVVKQLEK